MAYQLVWSSTSWRIYVAANAAQTMEGINQRGPTRTARGCASPRPWLCTTSPSCLL